MKGGVGRVENVKAEVDVVVALLTRGHPSAESITRLVKVNGVTRSLATERDRQARQTATNHCNAHDSPSQC
jgi:hypothetical protein